LELWGFERIGFIDARPGACLAIDPSGGAGGAPKEETPPPKYHVAHIEKRNVEDAADVAKVNVQQDVWVAFTAQDAKKTTDTKKLLMDSKSKPAAGTLWSYRIKYTELDGKAGVTCQEEADEVQKEIEELPEYEALHKIDATPTVYTLSNEDKDNDSFADVNENLLTGYNTLSKNGPDKNGQFDVSSSNPLNDFISNSTPENLARLRADRAATNRLIQRLLAALEAGNLDVLMPLMDCIAKVSNMTVAEVGAKVARLLGASDKEAAEIGKRLQEINMGSKDPETRAKANQDVQNMQLQLQQNTQGRQQIVGMLQSTMEMSRGIGDANKEFRQANLARQRAQMVG